MEITERSSFIRGVENRLNTLFGEDTDKGNKKEGQSESSMKVHPSLSEITPEMPLSVGKDQIMGKSPFITGIEERFNSIFGDDAKETGSKNKATGHFDIETIIPEEDPNINQYLSQVRKEAAASKSILDSVLKDLKSIVLSIEWEISDKILEDFDHEINRLHDYYKNDRIILGFLRILRFLGRYIRISLIESHHGSITLLLSVYDNMEVIILSNEMTEGKKHSILCEDIIKYQIWVDKIDLDAKLEAAVEEQGIEPFQDVITTGQEKALPPKEVIATQEPVTPVPETVIPIPEKPSPLPEWQSEGDGAFVIAEPLALSRPSEPVEREITEIQPSDIEKPIEEVPTGIDSTQKTVHPGIPDNVAKTLSSIKDLTPHEAFAYALEDIKKTINAEFSAIRTELRLWREGQ